ncbi:uncharacterized protein F5147DRAFT_745761 [Suillus discolor]|uniref:Uncharacterized protein n=1 Tax=Suillus discolor TaxID=1912936 RepID=A0A9P7JU87_9AGAM|nr:uncharacterized protein F5147DRAFT_745761 [Suillus discolor]KAG2108471.1 hypothetical protein F5147DRAFT_745761 [Suillus discolor]
MVGTFHSHAHNHKCQLVWHPMYILGTGHSEGEGCKHIFSASNELTRSTRHASPFHWHQTIKEHFAFWNADKYAVLSNFLSTELAIIQSELGLTDVDFPRFLKEEHDYLDGSKQSPEKDYLSVWYIEVLDKLAEWRADWDLACEAANSSLTAIAAGNLEQINNALSQARIQVDSSYAKLQHAEALVVHIEALLAEYNHFKEEVSLSKYHSALDDLEHLVVMRLFELSKFDWATPAHQEVTTKYFKLCRAHKEITQLNVEVRRLHMAIHDEELHTSTII